MITIKGMNIDFNLTSPSDMRRLYEARERADKRKAEVETKAPTDAAAPDYLTQYVDWLNALLNIYGNFIDDAFGEGMAEKLLTNNPSLDRVLDVNDELEAALGVHVQAITARFGRYKPNRAAMREKQ